MGSVYKLTDGVLNYYGSTETSLQKRLVSHKKKNNVSHSNKLNRDNLTIELLEFVENLQELKTRERYFIENNECVNKNIPARTTEERNNYLKNYHANNYIKNRLKNQNKITCICGRTIQISNVKHKKSKVHMDYLYFT